MNTHAMTDGPRALLSEAKALLSKVQSLMGVLALGRKSIKAGESYHLREPSNPYGEHFGGKKGDIAYISTMRNRFPAFIYKALMATQNPPPMATRNSPTPEFRNAGMKKEKWVSSLLNRPQDVGIGFSENQSIFSPFLAWASGRVQTKPLEL